MGSVRPTFSCPRHVQFEKCEMKIFALVLTEIVEARLVIHRFALLIRTVNREPCWCGAE